jgi:hypothetical protein
VLLLITDKPSPDAPSAGALSPVTPAHPPAGPDLGVIEEARRRQRKRRIRIAFAALGVTVLIGVLMWSLDGGASHATLGHAGSPGGAYAVDTSDHHVAFNVRLVPTLTVGQAGWCEVIEENGVTGGSACGGAPTPAQPMLQVQGSYTGGAPYKTTVVVSDPQVAAILANRTLRAPTLPLPGLPYGLRGTLIKVAANAQTAPHSPHYLLQRYATDPTLVALDAQGHPIPQRWQRRIPLQAIVRSWHYPSAPPSGSCRLHATLPGLTARSGQVASAIRPFPGRLVGHAFLPCVATAYELHGLPLRATMVLDAANPRTRAAALPDFKPVPKMPGFFAQGGLTARRSGNAWLIAAQGAGVRQRIQLLRQITAIVKS